MNKNIKVAVAGAVLALSASAANAGIVIPAGDWTLDINGNMNAFFTSTRVEGDLATADTPRTANVIQTGLLPSMFGVGAKTRQNDLDVAFQFSFWTGVDSGVGGSGGNNSLNIRQAYLTFGDKSWGQFLLGRELGVFGSDAILSDMTLLGVGVGAGAGGNSTLGRIGSGYMYADWVGQIQYQTPNFSGFQFTAAVVEPMTNSANGFGTTYTAGDYASNATVRNTPGYQAKATYDFATSNMTGRVWVGGLAQKHKVSTSGNTSFWNGSNDYTSKGGEVGVKVQAGDFGVVAYGYDGNGLSGPSNILNGLLFRQGGDTQDRGGYVQGTYVLPSKTKLGLSWGKSKSDLDGYQFENQSSIAGLYHPLTKHLNLVAEYTNQKLDNYTLSAGYGGGEYGQRKTVSLGAILFF